MAEATTAKGEARNKRGSDNKWYKVLPGGNPKCPDKCTQPHGKDTKCHMDHTDK